MFCLPLLLLELQLNKNMKHQPLLYHTSTFLLLRELEPLKKTKIPLHPPLLYHHKTLLHLLPLELFRRHHRVHCMAHLTCITSIQDSMTRDSTWFPKSTHQCHHILRPHKVLLSHSQRINMPRCHSQYHMLKILRLNLFLMRITPINRPQTRPLP